MLNLIQYFFNSHTLSSGEGCYTYLQSSRLVDDVIPRVYKNLTMRPDWSLESLGRNENRPYFSFTETTEVSWSIPDKTFVFFFQFRVLNARTSLLQPKVGDFVQVGWPTYNCNHVMLLLCFFMYQAVLFQVIESIFITASEQDSSELGEIVLIFAMSAP
jgi:hypothetical protein